MATALNIEGRIIAHTIAKLKADNDLATATGSRIYRAGDISHKAIYPTITLQVMNVSAFGSITGWYSVALNIAAKTYEDDDKTVASLDTLSGHIRRVLQSSGFTQHNTETELADTTNTITIVDAQLDDSHDMDEGNVRVRNIAAVVVLRPSTGTNQG